MSRWACRLLYASAYLAEMLVHHGAAAVGEFRRAWRYAREEYPEGGDR